MRGRIVGLAVVLAIAGTSYLDAVSPPVPEARTAIAGTGSSVLVCPLAFVPGGRAFLHLANASPDPAHVRVTLAPEHGKRATIDLRLRPGAVRNVRLHGRVARTAGAIVEHGGGRIVATHTLVMPRVEGRLFRATGGAGAGGGACVRPGAPRQVLAGARTLRARGTLALFNPGASAAEADVSFHADGRALFPTRLRGVVVRPRRVSIIDLGNYAFDARDVTAVVVANAGRVVAEAMVRTPGGLTLTGGGSPLGRTALLAARGGEGAFAGVVAIGESDAELDSVLLTGQGQGKAPRVPPALAPGEAKRAPVPRGGPFAYSLSVPFGSPVAGVASWADERPRGAERSAVEALAPSRHLVALAGAMGERVSARVLVAALDSPARIRLARLGSDAEPTEIVVPAGRVRAIRLARGPGAFALELLADQPVVAATVVVSVDRVTRAAAIPAVPLDEPRAVAVVSDPRAGAPR